jgi:hypothetical protein
VGCADFEQEGIHFCQRNPKRCNPDGGLRNATSTDTTSENQWVAPLCMPAGTLAVVTVTVADEQGLTATRPFSVTVNDCPAPSVSAGDAYSLTLRADGAL